MRLDHLLSKEDEKANHELSKRGKLVKKLLFNFEGASGKTFEKKIRGFSSAGRAPALQAGGQGFDSLNLHQRYGKMG